MEPPPMGARTQPTAAPKTTGVVNIVNYLQAPGSRVSMPRRLTVERQRSEVVWVGSSWLLP
jgi:hypothetical protein